MKKYKIVKHYYSGSDHMYRVYKRQWLFSWEWLTSYQTIERCEHYIASLIEKEQAEREAVANTPKDELVRYL